MLWNALSDDDEFLDDWKGIIVFINILISIRVVGVGLREVLSRA